MSYYDVNAHVCYRLSSLEKHNSVLLVVGPMKTALTSFKWAQDIYPKMTAALGALHALYVVGLDLESTFYPLILASAKP